MKKSLPLQIYLRLDVCCLHGDSEVFWSVTNVITSLKQNFQVSNLNIDTIKYLTNCNL